VTVDRVADATEHHLADVFATAIRHATPAELGLEVPAAA
jgi:hypothetical protein